MAKRKILFWVVIFGGQKFSFTVQISSSWTKNQIDKREMNRKISKSIMYVHTGNSYRHEIAKTLKKNEVHMSS